MSFVINLAVGTLTGLITGFGIGGGTLLMIYMMILTGFPQLTAQGINLIYFLPTAGSALVAHIRNGLVDRRAFFWAGGTGLAATVVAAWAVGMLDVAILRRVFGAFLLVVGVSELFRPCK